MTHESQFILVAGKLLMMFGFMYKANILNLTLVTRHFNRCLILCIFSFTMIAYAGPPPVFKAQPASQTVSLGGSPSFSTTASSGTVMTYQWYFNGTMIKGATNTSYVLTNTQFTNAGLYYVAVKNAAGTVKSTNATLNVNPPAGSSLPAPWVSVDIGTVLLGGSGYYSSNIFTVNGSGASLVGATADQFRYVYQTMSGDGSIVAHVVKQSGTNVNGYAGIMIRETTATGSRYMLAARQGNGVALVRSRASTGGATTSINGSNLALPNYWLELVRTGNNISALTSSNGLAWTAIQTNSITMATNVTFGLFVTSGYTNVLDSDLFTNVTAVP
jgi:hypothetical protein